MANSWDPELYESRHAFIWQLGAGVVDLLDPKPGERILDLGCGPGHLTANIGERGAIPVGIDSSPEMIGQARQNYPQLVFVLEDATRMNYRDEFDAVFSNAALHWMLDRSAVLHRIADALKTSGRFVAELGGRGNLAAIHAAIQKIVPRYRSGPLPEARTYYPSPGEYATLAEQHGLEVRLLELFDRPTRLEGCDGLRNWLHQFKGYYFDEMPAEHREEALRDIAEELRPQLFRDESWYADYRRLRIVAVKL